MKQCLLISLFLLIIGSCSKQSDFIPEVYVDIVISLNQPEYSNLNTVGNYIFITGGSRGIIIYNNGLNNYRAYDRNCSFNPSNSCSLIDSINSTIAACSCCDSKFLLDQGGTPANGPALLPLKEYTTMLVEDKLYIHN